MKKITYIIIAVAVFLLLLELLLRLFGFQPHRVSVDPFAEKMRGAFYPIDSIGVGATPGHFSVQIENQKIIVNHDSFRCRRTFKSDTSTPLALLLGCSFTYGYGLSDWETYPYLLDSACAFYHFMNMAYPGDGTIQAKMRLKKYLNSPGLRRPAAVVVNYLSFHDERNALNSRYRQKLYDGYLGLLSSTKSKGQPLCEMHYPFVVCGDRSCTISYLARTQLVRGEFPLIRHSALANLVSSQLTSCANDRQFEKEVSFNLLLQMNTMCREKNIAFYVSYMEHQKEVTSLIEICQKNKIPTIDLSIDFHDPQNFDLSFDPLHAGAKANRIFMKKFKDYLTQCSNQLK